MQAVEFEGTVTEAGQIQLPAELIAHPPAGSYVRVVVMWETAEEEDEAWRRMSMRNLARQYAPEDAIYEKLLDEPPSR
jgi:hypothetical protein